MKKIGIVTLFGYENYGNRLQMYATQKIYSELGYDSEILKIISKNRIKDKLKKIIKLIIDFKNEKIRENKIKRFEEHSKKYIKESKKYVNFFKPNKSLNEYYDFFSVGSDQIWSQNVVNYKNKDLIFLRFTSKEKRIAYSPSFGHSEIRFEYNDLLKEMFSGFEEISVREQAGKNIIQKILPQKKVEVLLDPTMNVDKKIWEEFSEQHKYKPQKKYIVTYFLGNPCKKALEVLEKYEKDYQVVKLNDFSQKKYYDINPSEWVDFIKDSSLFLTDSFHGVAFALILGKPFSVYERIGGSSMNSRIQTILSKFKVEERADLDKDDQLLLSPLPNIEDILIQEKIKTLNFLKSSLEIKK